MFKYRMNEIEDMSQLFVNLKGGNEEAASGEISRTDANTIFFYSHIDVATCAELNRHLRELETRLRIVGVNYDVTPNVKLRINSGGGDIMAAYSVVDTIKDLKVPVDTYIEGLAASAATLISISGTNRYMYRNAHLLIHQLSSGFYGKYNEFEDEIYNITNLMKMIKTYYKQNTKIPMKRLEELLKRDIYLNAEECLEYGIIDKIL
jgi:ATP-dependent Clp endopeptidase proteolytic subunit ClpP